MAVLIGLAVLALPVPAGAAVTCSLSGTTLSVSLSEPEDVASVIRVGTEIEVRDGDDRVGCGGSPQVDTVDTVIATDTSTGTTTFTIDLSGGPFAPGATAAGEGTSPEIEFQVNLGGQFPDRLAVVGTAGPEDMTFSSAGINLGAGETPTVDADVSSSGVEEFEVLAGGGADEVTGQPLIGGTFTSKMILRGEDGADDLTGGGGPDDLHGGPDGDLLDGGAGADRVLGEGEGDTLTGAGGGDDLFGGGAPDNLDGEDGNDRLDGGEGNDLEEGGQGDDAFDQGPGSNGGDTLDGSGGFDVAAYDLRQGNLTIQVGAAGGDGEAGEGDDVRGTVEAVLGGSGDDSLVGADLTDNVLRGGAGTDAIAGGTGDDLIDGDAGSDDLDGEGGEDTVSFFGAPAVSVNLLTGQATGDGADALANLENAEGGSHGDTLIGHATGNTLTGRGGADSLDGGGGGDEVEGGEGSDTLAGGPGNDAFRGGGGADTASYAGSAVSVTVNLRAGIGTGEGTDSLHGVENAVGSEAGDSLTGSDQGNLIIGAGGRDAIFGLDGDDDLRGSAGDDAIDGDGGKDVIAGGDGNDSQVGSNGADLFREGEQPGSNGSDQLSGGSGRDMVSYGGRRKGVRVSLGAAKGDGQKGEGDRIGGDVEQARGTGRRDILVGSGGKNTLLGGGGNDLLQGRGGIDRLVGSSGNDRLDGGPGNDVCRGGGGKDVLRDCGKEKKQRRRQG
jgi:Ca2+-binding RTX toxin-like protein